MSMTRNPSPYYFQTIKNDIMRKQLLLLMLALTTAITVFADRRSLQDMKAIAQYVLVRNTNNARRMVPSEVKMNLVRDNEVLTIFATGDAFVIVSAEEEIAPVLGYSQTKYDEKMMPPALKAWLHDIETGAAKPVDVSLATTSIEAVTPFVTTKWNQEEPYSNLTPMDGNSHSLTGCVATAFAQVINYCQYPASAAFQGKYTIGESEAVKYSPVNSTYSYPLLDSYGYYIGMDGSTHEQKYSEAQATAIATLMRDCGYSVSMNYSANGSGAVTAYVATAAIDYFNYPRESIKMFSSYYHAEDEMYNAVISEIKNKRPVIHGGQDTGNNGGHAFVFCGMDAEGLVYVNWGWSGQYDGYYAFTALKTSAGNFINSRSIITGFSKDPLPTDKRVVNMAFDGDYVVTGEVGKISIAAAPNRGIFNFGSEDFTGDLNLIFEDKQTGAITRKNISTITTPVSILSGLSLNRSFRITSFTPGEYRVYVEAKHSQLEEYFPVRIMERCAPIYYNVKVEKTSDNKIKFSVIGEPEVVTGINIIENDSPTRFDNTFYSISGQKVSNNYHGIIIQNGKKVLK